MAPLLPASRARERHRAAPSACEQRCGGGRVPCAYPPRGSCRVRTILAARRPHHPGAPSLLPTPDATADTPPAGAGRARRSDRNRWARGCAPCARSRASGGRFAPAGSPGRGGGRAHDTPGASPAASAPARTPAPSRRRGPGLARALGRPGRLRLGAHALAHLRAKVGGGCGRGPGRAGGRAGRCACASTSARLGRACPATASAPHAAAAATAPKVRARRRRAERRAQRGPACHALRLDVLAVEQVGTSLVGRGCSGARGAPRATIACALRLARRALAERVGKRRPARRALRLRVLRVVGAGLRAGSRRRRLAARSVWRAVRLGIAARRRPVLRVGRVPRALGRLHPARSSQKGEKAVARANLDPGSVSGIDQKRDRTWRFDRSGSTRICSRRSTAFAPANHHPGQLSQEWPARGVFGALWATNEPSFFQKDHFATAFAHLRSRSLGRAGPPAASYSPGRVLPLRPSPPAAPLARGARAAARGRCARAA